MFVCLKVQSAILSELVRMQSTDKEDYPFIIIVIIIFFL